MENQITRWPALPYNDFLSTSYLLHHITQIVGKLKLYTPFEAHWANVALWLTSQGLTTGPIFYQSKFFSIDFDLINHHLLFVTSNGDSEKLNLESGSVAEFYQKIFATLHHLKININVNPMPQEIANPILFDKDHEKQNYNSELANSWWKILLNVYHVMLQYHARFDGETPPIGLMWGTFDLRDARYNGIHVPTTGINAGYIRRNAMNEAQVEIGWWPGNEMYTKPAFYSFIHPQPQGIEKVIIQPLSAHWDSKLFEFILDYEDVRQSNSPEKDLLAFFESTYAASTQLAGWNPKLVTEGEPV